MSNPFFSNNRLFCDKCGNNDIYLIFSFSDRDNSKLVYQCFCGNIVKTMNLSDIIDNLGKGGIKK